MQNFFQLTTPPMLNDFREFFHQLPDLFKRLLLVAFPIFDADSVFYFIYAISFIIIALGVYYVCEAKAKGFGLRKALAYCFPRTLYTQRSAFLDYKTYFLNEVIFMSVIVSIYLNVFDKTNNFLGESLDRWFGAFEGELEPTLALQVLYTFLSFLVVDLSLYWGHYLVHKIPFLWEFHKVHHSAEGLNPITSARMHPVDLAFNITVQAFFVGVFNGFFSYFINREIEEIYVGGLLISSLLFNLVVNLRHSHIWVSYGWHLNHIFTSPAMHQIHHSKKAEHIDKNLGRILSFWDYLFGTIYVPKVREELSVGVEEKDYDNIWQLYYSPFVGAYKVLVKKASDRPSISRDVGVEDRC